MKFWSFDTETWIIQPGLLAPKLVCFSYADESGEWIGSAADASAWFRSTLERGDHLAGVNIAYDVVVLAAHDPTLLPLIFQAGNAGQFHDCSIREALHDIAVTGGVVDENRGGGRYSMALLMQRHFQKDISADKTGDVWRYSYHKLDGIPIAQWPPAAVEYPKQDARRTWDIWAVQEGLKAPIRTAGKIFEHCKPAQHRNLHDEPAQVRAAIAIQLMCAWGIRTDWAYLEHLEKEITSAWEQARTELAKHGIFRPDGTKDTAAVKARVKAAYENPPTTPSGDISIDRDTLTESGDPVLVALGNAGKRDKYLSTNIPALRKGTLYPINPKFNPLVGTGRVSSDWQQLPQKGGLREAVVARPGKVNGSLDYGGLELRTMSQRAILNPRIRFSKMADFIRAKKDPHCYVGGFFKGLTYEEAKNLHDAKDPTFKPLRDVAKIFNFGAGGGAGGFAIAYNAKVKDNIRLCLSLKRAEKCGVKKEIGYVLGKPKQVCALCIQIAKELKAKWLEAWPEQKLLFQIAGERTKNNQKVEIAVFGSKRVRGKCGYTQWLNTPFQGAGADGMKRAMWRIEEEQYTVRRSPLYGCRNLLNIHDELWIEFPDSPQQRHDAAFRAAEIMVSTMNEITPDVPNECTPALARRMFKAASDVYDRNGLLKPWWPADWSWAADQEQMQRDLAA